MNRIDRLITPPGLIARARMYTLLITDNHLYVLNTGKAANPTFLYYGGRYSGTAAILQSGYDPEIATHQRTIDSGDFESLLTNKHSKKYAASEIESITFVDTQIKGDCIQLVTKSKKYNFVLPRDRAEEARTFVQRCADFLASLQ